MPVSSSASSIIRFLEESTPGVIGSGNPQTYRVTGGGLNQSTTSVQDDELRSDRGRGDSTLVGGSVAGQLDINWSHKTHDSFLESLLSGTFTRVGTDGVATVTDMDFDNATHTINSIGGNLPTLEKGQWFQISGAADSDNDGIYKASDSVAPTTSSITVDTLVKDVVTSAAASTVISSSRLKQGNADQRTWTLERELSDVSQFFTWPHCVVSSMNLSYADQQKLKGNFGFMAAADEQQGTVSKFPGIGSALAATTTPHFNVVTGTSFLLDGAAMGESCMESLTVDIQAGIRERRCLGSGLSASSLAEDQFTMSISASIFFGTVASANLYKKKLLDQPLTFACCLKDADGNGFAVNMPRGKITSAEVSAGALGSDVILSLNFDAVTDPDSSTMLMVDVLGSVA